MPCLFGRRGPGEDCKSMSVATVRSVKLGRISALTTLQCNESWMELDTQADTTVLGKSKCQ